MKMFKKFKRWLTPSNKRVRIRRKATVMIPLGVYLWIILWLKYYLEFT